MVSITRHEEQDDLESGQLTETYDDIEKGVSGKPSNYSKLGFRVLLWTLVNIISTVAIVSFATYHFFITGATLWVASRSWCNLFVPKKVNIRQILPLSAAMGFQVILQNLGLANSSVMFYQLARLLLTPVTALFNYILYGVRIPRAAIAPLVLLCSGVGIVSYYDSIPKDDGKTSTSVWGIIFSLSGVGASAIYTVWIGYYHKKLEMSSMQLLLNQAPISAGLLLITIPWIETPPSGVFACLVNLSGFYIIDAAGPVSSTVIGQLKTCVIVGLGWATNSHIVMRQSMVGVVFALFGMGLYMNIILRKQHVKA
ncbi:hypothetical protein EYZ11_008761 [Aspergillus tanneri]|uniref:GDP-mannose transporter n=1 Tax=Aspergillus tanneri TaxID=1220188 RepID=A0A4S3J9M9_9EURO|nr:hypothetical protein EYZ11_008761 [Aspergillus tanneri]